MSELDNFRKHLITAEKEINLIRQRLEDSTVAVTQKEVIPMDNSNLITLMSDDEWEFNGSNRKGQFNGDLKVLVDAMKMLTRSGDKVRLGPFATEERTRSVQSQIGNVVYGDLKWQREPDGTDKGRAPYESHIKPSQPLYLYIRRNYAP